MASSNLTEGMRTGDLTDLVLPLLSVDEFQSKVDPNAAIVIGFYVHDKDAAADLNRFLQKSAIELIDTDISPAPDQHGYYLVFVELLNNRQFVTNVKKLLDEVSPLAGISEWRMRVRRIKRLQAFSPDRLARVIKKINEAEVLSFLAASDLSAAYFDDQDLIIETANQTFRFEVVGFGEEAGKLMDELNLRHAPVSLTLKETVQANRFARLLGVDWLVHRVDQVLFVAKIDGGPTLAVKG